MGCGLAGSFFIFSSQIPSKILIQLPLVLSFLTHWGRVMHICIGKLTIIGLYNGLAPGWHQAIIWTNAGILFIGHLGTNWNFNRNSYIFILENRFENVWKMAAILSRSQCVKIDTFLGYIWKEIHIHSIISDKTNNESYLFFISSELRWQTGLFRMQITISLT